MKRSASDHEPGLRIQYSCGIFIDVCMAFDTVDYHVLLDKFEYYGIVLEALHMNAFLPAYLIGVNLFH